MEFNGFESVQEAAEMQELQDMNEAIREPEVMEVPGMGDVLVGGEPYEVADSLDDSQGDNLYNCQGDCGLVSVANLLTLAGQEVTEDDVVGTALANGLCQYDPHADPGENGGTNGYSRQALLGLYGISSSVYDDKNGAGSLDAIADYVDAGHGVNISVNAGYAWGEPAYVGDGSSNHSIIVTGSVRDPETGDLKGLIVCDSGLTDRDSASMFLSVEELEDAYVNANGSTCLVTDEPIR